MRASYDPKAYWQARLAAHGGLRGVGHLSFGERYNRWLYRAKRRTLESALPGSALAGRTVLDVGCGTGYFVQWYLERGARVTGIDIAANGIEALRRRYAGDFRVLDVSAPGAASLGEHDVVNAWDVMYHIVDEAAFGRAVAYLAAATRPGGVLLVTDQFAAAADRSPAPHVRLRCLATYEQALTRLGLRLERLHFLYRWLNRRVTLPAIDSLLGRLYYSLDAREQSIPAGNLSLAVWRRIASS